MNAEQLSLFINGAFGSEAEARQIARLLRPTMRRSFLRVRELVETLADESLKRQMEWTEILKQIELELAPYGDKFGQVLAQELPIDGERAAKETIEMLRTLKVPVPAGNIAPSLVMADSTKFLLATKVNGRRVLSFFIPGSGDDPSPFIKSLSRRIDRTVVTGILKGTPTARIARDLAETLPKATEAATRALARTAIQDYNRQVKEAVWEQNKEALVGLKYEWVAALDSRTCEVCAPLDGEVRDSKDDFDETPVHPNCRCQVVLVDPDDPARIRYGQEALERQATGPGSYKTKKKVKGENLFRKKVKVQTVDGKSPKYADFLASSNPKTQQMFFGGGARGTARAQRFRRAVGRGTSPQQALVDVIGR